MRDETNLKPGTKKRRTYTKERERQANCQSARSRRIKKQHEIVLGRLRRTGYKRGSYLYRIAEGTLRETARIHLVEGLNYKDAFERAMMGAQKRANNSFGSVQVDELLQLLYKTDRKVHNEMRTAQPGKRRLLQAA